MQTWIPDEDDGRREPLDLPRDPRRRMSTCGGGPGSSIAMVDDVRTGRIIGAMDSHAVVTTTCHVAGAIVTEYSSAALCGLAVRERAHATVTIAHPEFADELPTCAESPRR